MRRKVYNIDSGDRGEGNGASSSGTMGRKESESGTIGPLNAALGYAYCTYYIIIIIYYNIIMIGYLRSPPRRGFALSFPAINL